MERHSKTFVSFEIVRLNDFSGVGLDSDFPSIKMGEDKVNSSERLKKSNLLLNQEISSLSLEGFMFLFINLDDDISGFNVR